MADTTTLIEPQAIATHGWQYYSKCRCGGILKHKYRNPSYPELELEWWVKYGQFRITYRGTQTKVAPTAVSQLNEVLNSLNLTATV